MFSAGLGGAGDWWDPDGSIGAGCIAGVWQSKAVASLAASYLRLAGNQGYANIDPAIVEGVAPNWDAVNGWGFNGTTHYLDTGIVPGSAWSALCQFSGATSPLTYRTLFGSHTGGSDNRFYIRQQIPDTMLYANGLTLIVPPKITLGNMGMAGQTAYRNGVSDGAILAGGVEPVLPIYIGARNLSGVASELYFGNLLALAIYSCTLTAPQMALVAAAMAAL